MCPKASPQSLVPLARMHIWQGPWMMSAFLISAAVYGTSIKVPFSSAAMILSS